MNPSTKAMAVSGGKSTLKVGMNSNSNSSSAARQENVGDPAIDRIHSKPPR